MSILSRLYITALVMFRSLVPARQGNTPPEMTAALPSPPGCHPVPAGEISQCLADISRAVRIDGKLLLFLPGCQAPAAPFILFRLKREGYSNCTVTASADGLLVEAKR
jgi:hypothetical protein